MFKSVKLKSRFRLSAPLVMFVFLLCCTGAKAQTIQENNEEENERTDRVANTQCGGVERWSVKVFTDAAASQINFTPIITTIDSLVHIATPTPTGTEPRIAGLEFQAYRVRCNIIAKREESDNDYHLTLSSGGYTMIGEIPDPVCSEAASSAHANEFRAARAFIGSNIASGNVYTVNLPPVVVTGVTFLDPPHGQSGAAPNNLELHAIVNVRFDVVSGITDPLGEAGVFSVSTFPDPFTDFCIFHILTGNQGFSIPLDLDIYNLNGQCVYHRQLPSAVNGTLSFRFENPSLPSGLYLYSLSLKGLPVYHGKLVRR